MRDVYIFNKIARKRTALKRNARKRTPPRNLRSSHFYHSIKHLSLAASISCDISLFGFSFILLLLESCVIVVCNGLFVTGLVGGQCVHWENNNQW